MKGDIIARDLVETFVGEWNGVVFRINEYRGSYWEPDEVEIEYLEGVENLPEDEEEFEQFEEELLRRVRDGEYTIPDDVQDRLDRYLKWEDEVLGLHGENE